MSNYINHLYNWSGFYRALCQTGSALLLGVDEDLREFIKMSSMSTDIFWSDGLEELLAIGATNDDIRAGVLSALELWRENVLEKLDSNFSIELDWEMVSVDYASPLIDELIKAALPN